MTPLALLANHDRFAGSLLCIGAVMALCIGYLLFELAASGGTPRERRAFDASLEAERAPGLGVLDGGAVEPDPATPLFDATSLHLLDAELPTVYDAEDWPGGAA